MSLTVSVIPRHLALFIGALALCFTALTAAQTASSTVAPTTDTAASSPLRYGASTTRPYADVYADVEFAIAEHNFRITGGNRIGGAILERGYDNFPSSDIVHFCNLEYARQFLTLSADYLLHMPCKVVLIHQILRCLPT